MIWTLLCLGDPEDMYICAELVWAKVLVMIATAVFLGMRDFYMVRDLVQYLAVSIYIMKKRNPPAFYLYLCIHPHLMTQLPDKGYKD